MERLETWSKLYQSPFFPNPADTLTPWRASYRLHYRLKLGNESSVLDSTEPLQEAPWVNYRSDICNMYAIRRTVHQNLTDYMLTLMSPDNIPFLLKKLWPSPAVVLMATCLPSMVLTQCGKFCNLQKPSVVPTRPFIQQMDRPSPCLFSFSSSESHIIINRSLSDSSSLCFCSVSRNMYFFAEWCHVIM